jgi:hypothetical protein
VRKRQNRGNDFLEVLWNEILPVSSAGFYMMSFARKGSEAAKTKAQPVVAVL